MKNVSFVCFGKCGWKTILDSVLHFINWLEDGWILIYIGSLVALLVVLTLEDSIVHSGKSKVEKANTLSIFMKIA